jgi:hypothetical protein
LGAARQFGRRNGRSTLSRTRYYGANATRLALGGGHNQDGVMSKTKESGLEFARAVFADAALALVATVVIGLVIASLAAAGIITMNLAYAMLALAWIFAVGGSFLLPRQMAYRHRVIFAALLFAMLAAVGWYETANFEKPPTAKEIAQEIAKLSKTLPGEPVVKLPASEPVRETAPQNPVASPNPKKRRLASTYNKMILVCDKPTRNKEVSLEERQAELAKYADVMEKIFGYSIKVTWGEDETKLEITPKEQNLSSSFHVTRQIFFIKRSGDQIYVTVTNEISGAFAFLLTFPIVDPEEATVKQIIEYVERTTNAEPGKCKLI